MDLQLIGNLFGNLSYICLVLAFMMRNMITLRVLSILSALFFIIYSFLYSDTPLWVTAGWEFTFLSVNVVQLIITWLERREGSFSTEDELFLRQHVFDNMSPKSFKKFMSVGKLTEAEEGQKLITEGKKVDSLIIITKGKAAVRVGERVVAHCNPGNFLGEMSFLTGNNATASVFAQGSMRYMHWNQHRFEELLAEDHDIENKVYSCFIRDLIRKVTAQSKQSEPVVDANPKSDF